MLALSLIPFLATFATAAQYFNLIGLRNDEVHIPSTDHLITFDISNPDADYEQGGSDYATCKLKWDSEFPPTCWTACNSTSAAWYTRITPSYPYSYTNFSLDIQEYYETVHAPLMNNVSVVIKSGVGGYYCSNGEQTSLCGQWSGQWGIYGSNYSYYSYVGGGDMTALC